MNQISPKTDKRMNELSRKIGLAEVKIEEGTKEKDEAFREVWELYAEHDVPGFRFLADDGHAIEQQIRNGTPKLNAETLKEELLFVYGEKKGKALWKQITITVEQVQTAVLEGLIQQGKIAADVVDRCITIPEPTAARIRRKWTKEDKARATEIGINIKETVNA